MTHYRQVGTVPQKRHTAFRDAGGALHFEELMGAGTSRPSGTPSTGRPRAASSTRS